MVAKRKEGDSNDAKGENCMQKIGYLVLVTVFLLLGCDEKRNNSPDCVEIAKESIAISRESTQRSKDILQKYDVLRSEYEKLYEFQTYREQQASIVKGCDAFFPICPPSATKEGRMAIAEGYGGLDSFDFWLIVIGKIVFALGLIGVLFYLLRWIKARVLLKVRFDALKTAQLKCAEDRSTLDKEKQHCSDLKRSLENQLSSVNEKANEIEAKIRTATTKLDEQIESIERYQQIIDDLAQSKTLKQNEGAQLDKEIAEKQRILRALDDALENG